MDLDPLNLRRQSVLWVFALSVARQYDRAIQQLQTVLALNPNHPASASLSGIHLLGKEDVRRSHCRTSRGSGAHWRQLKRSLYPRRRLRGSGKDRPRQRKSSKTSSNVRRKVSTSIHSHIFISFRCWVMRMKPSPGLNRSISEHSWLGQLAESVASFRSPPATTPASKTSSGV